MLPRESEPDLLQAQRLNVPLFETCPVRRLPPLCMCFSFVCASHLCSIRCHAQSFSLSIHSLMYEAQFSSFTPSASQRTKKRITSRSITPTSFRPKSVSRQAFNKSPRLGCRLCFDSAT